ncbi:hypothetical protein QBC43DRAFT_4884 [Cladorrhinum sp. PSN259]|nr:hypothetical protein QBC43DRAFT_4884 [Cladorrhinum sp. PSN259]
MCQHPRGRFRHHASFPPPWESRPQVLGLPQSYPWISATSHIDHISTPALKFDINRVYIYRELETCSLNILCLCAEGKTEISIKTTSIHFDCPSILAPKLKLLIYQVCTHGHFFSLIINKGQQFSKRPSKHQNREKKHNPSQTRVSQGLLNWPTMKDHLMRRKETDQNQEKSKTRQRSRKEKIHEAPQQQHIDVSNPLPILPPFRLQCPGQPIPENPEKDPNPRYNKKHPRCVG